MSVRVRPWRVGDKPTCAWASKPRTITPPCGPPVAVATVTDVTEQWLPPEQQGQDVRTYAVCEMHRRAIYDGTTPSRRRARQAHALGVQAMRGEA